MAALVRRRLDVQVRRRVRDAGRDLRVQLEPLERERHALGVARDLGRGGVGQVLAPSRERELQQRRGDRREDRGREHADQDERVAAAVAAVAARAAEERQPQDEVGDERDHADEHRGEAHQAHVAVADVRDLVREHALELATRHRVEQARRDGDVGVLGVASRRERVRGRVVDDVERRRRGQAGADRDRLERAPRLGVVLRVDPRRARRGRDHAARREPRDDAVDDRDDAEEDQEPGAEREPEHQRERRPRAARTSRRRAACASGSRGSAPAASRGHLRRPAAGVGVGLEELGRREARARRSACPGTPRSPCCSGARPRCSSCAPTRAAPRCP